MWIIMCLYPCRESKSTISASVQRCWRWLDIQQGVYLQQPQSLNIWLNTLDAVLFQCVTLCACMWTKMVSCKAEDISLKVTAVSDSQTAHLLFWFLCTRSFAVWPWGQTYEMCLCIKSVLYDFLSSEGEQLHPVIWWVFNLLEWLRMNVLIRSDFQQLCQTITVVQYCQNWLDYISVWEHAAYYNLKTIKTLQESLWNIFFPG